MHKDAFASGFLFHIHSQQILLQRYKTAKNPELEWALFEGIVLPEESPSIAFQRIIHKHLRIKIPKDIITEVYTYYNDEKKKEITVVYAELTEVQDFPPGEDIVYTWVTAKSIDKLPIPAQAKHDITIGRRVISLKERKLLGTQAPAKNV